MEPVQELLKIWDKALKSATAEHQAEWDELHANNRYGASKIGSCLRASYLARKGAPETNHPTQAKQVVFSLGHRIEEWYIDTLTRYVTENELGYIDCQAEVADENHEAHTDGLWVNVENKIAVPIEVKSIHPSAIDNVERQNNGVWVPYSHHALQLSQFMYLAEKQGGYLLPNGERIDVSDNAPIYYISKDGRIRISVIKLSHYRDELVRRMNLLNQAWETQTAPDRMKDADSYPCSFGGSSACQFWDLCWTGRDGHTPKGSMLYLKSVGINVVRKDGYFINGEKYTDRGVVEFAVKHYAENKGKHLG